MTPSPMNPAGAYAKIALETGVAAAGPHKLIQMLFDAALARIAEAREALQARDVPGRGAALSRAIALVDDGLRASLDRASGGSLAGELDALYEYISLRLLTANAQSSAAALDEAGRLLGELRDAWRAIAPAAEAAGSSANSRLAA